MASGIVQSASFTHNRKLARYVKTELHEKTIEQASFSDKCNNKLRRVLGFRFSGLFRCSILVPVHELLKRTQADSLTDTSNWVRC
jgi:hypothetical protein